MAEERAAEEEEGAEEEREEGTALMQVWWRVWRQAEEGQL